MGDWLPKSVLCLRSYTKRMFVADLLAGITVGLVALPLAMAFAIASGVPHKQVYTAPSSRALRFPPWEDLQPRSVAQPGHSWSSCLALSGNTALTDYSCAPFWLESSC